jgi:dTDP-4-amino-4,6-dideoxygalactose transaminase
MEVPFVDLSRQFRPLLPEIRAAVNRVIERCAFINGPEVKAFETQMALWIGLPEVCAVSNGTHARYLAMKALGVGEGDEVITVPNTAFPTSEAIHLAGAEAVFADIAPGSFNLDPQAAEQAVSARTKAIIPVHLYGIPADMDAINALANTHGLIVIEDCAQAQGAKYKGQRVGTLGRAGCFSFFPSKNLGAFGDGGAVASADTEMMTRVRMLADHGRQKKYSHQLLGTNSRLDTIKAAQLSICLAALDEWNQQRRAAAELYTDLLHPYDEIVTPQVLSDCEPVWHLYVVRYKKRDELAIFLNDQGIKTGLHYPLALHLQPAYEDLKFKEGSFPQAERACQQVLSLPMFPKITEGEIKTVVAAIEKFLIRKKHHNPSAGVDWKFQTG